MRFPERDEAVKHCMQLAGPDMGSVRDTGVEVIISAPTKESGYAFMRGDSSELHYEDKYKITSESNYYESWVKNRGGKWIKSII